MNSPLTNLRFKRTTEMKLRCDCCVSGRATGGYKAELVGDTIFVSCALHEYDPIILPWVGYPERWGWFRIRNMSFSLTSGAVEEGIKDVTRRLVPSWLELMPGDLLWPCYKTMGLAKGEKVKRIRGPIRIVHTRIETLSLVDDEDVKHEGFPQWSRADFLEFAKKRLGADPLELVQRILFEYTDGGGKWSDERWSER